MYVICSHSTVNHPSSPLPVPAATAGVPSLNNPRKALEFDHARGYVKKIKQRFALQPHVYKSFLKILHTYHQEQHTIKDVYEHVAVLFAKHPDLLEEFTQFLPDPMAASQPPVPTQQRPKKPVRKKEKPEKLEKERVGSPSSIISIHGDRCCSLIPGTDQWIDP